MSTLLQAETAKDKLRTKLGQHPALNGIGLTWDEQGNYVILLILLEGADATGLDIPTTVDSIAVQVETRPRAVAL